MLEHDNIVYSVPKNGHGYYFITDVHLFINIFNAEIIHQAVL